MLENLSVLIKMISGPHISISLLSCTANSNVFIVSSAHLHFLLNSYQSSFYSHCPVEWWWLPHRAACQHCMTYDTVDLVPRDTHLPVSLSQSILAIQPYLPGLSTWKCHKIQSSYSMYLHILLKWAHLLY